LIDNVSSFKYLNQRTA